MKVRVEAISAFKQLTLIDHSRGRGAVGEPARPGGADNRSAFVLWSITRAILARNPHVVDTKKKSVESPFDCSVFATSSND